jgi:hypothetical protein
MANDTGRCLIMHTGTKASDHFGAEIIFRLALQLGGGGRVT